MIETVEKDFLQSYFIWKEIVTSDPNTFGGLQFPLTQEKWINLMREKAHPFCPICRSIGSYIIEEEKNNVVVARYVVKCLCNVARWTREQEIMTAEWKDPFRPTRWDEIKPSEAYGSIVQYQKAAPVTKETLEGLLNLAKGKNLRWHLIRGMFGSGKTTMLKALATELSPIATYVTAGNLKNHFRNAAMEEEGLSRLINAFSKVRILLIDDFGMEFDGSGYTTKTLRTIIDNRMAWAERFPTVMTTNLPVTHEGLMNMRNADDIRAIISRFSDQEYSDVHQLMQGDARMGKK